MTTELFLRYIHFISIFAIVGALASEYVLLKKTLTRGELSRLAKVDAVYGIAALTLLSVARPILASSVRACLLPIIGSARSFLVL